MAQDFALAGQFYDLVLAVGTELGKFGNPIANAIDTIEFFALFKNGLSFFNGLGRFGIGDLFQLLFAHGPEGVKLSDNTIFTPAFHTVGFT